MASTNINNSNLQTHIDVFKNDINNCFMEFKEVEDEFIKLKCCFQSHKSEMKNELSQMHHDLLRNLKGIDHFDTEDFHVPNYELQFTELMAVLQSSKRQFDKLHDTTKFLQAFDTTYEECLKCKAIDNYPKPSNKINLHILHSRQTEEPFEVKKMKTGSRYKCSGCNQNIPIQSLFLSHIEEYPSGTKTYIPHSYHISQNCLLDRGFEEHYLTRSGVISSNDLNDDIIDVLVDMGFKLKNIQSRKTDRDFAKGSIQPPRGIEKKFIKAPENVSKFHRARDNSDSVNSDDSDYPDDKSDISSVPSTASLTIPSMSFIYQRKPVTQKKIIVCQGCQKNIETECYISHENNKLRIPFHVNKSCLKLGAVLPNNFCRTVCKVGQLLKTHSELKELIACGFFFNKIIGFRPQNPNVKQIDGSMVEDIAPPIVNSKRPRPGDSGQSAVCDTAFIFNEEPFVFERLPHGEKCKGCKLQIKKDEVVLRHKERVPREKMNNSPLISQFYHVNRQCLVERGFTPKYLSFIKCNAMLSGDDNLSKVTEMLIKCGFFNDNIVYTHRDATEIRGFETPSQPMKNVKEYKLFIDRCISSSYHCEGCGFILTPNQPVFIYSLTAKQDGNAKLFHIGNRCLKTHFTKEQIMSITCVNNNLVDVSPNEIINCGIVKIITEDKYTMPPKRNVNQNKPQQKALNSFIVDIVVDNRYKCYTCGGDLMLDKYVLRMKKKDPEKSQIHLDSVCIGKLGLSPQELARCELLFDVYVSPEGMTRLNKCGFRNFPKH